ncbi:hypothetical protein CDL15_Pgr018327 [Punica granatum]|uniref:PHD and RING finger domain-containing protein 1 n=1 Tax=Punica granatum TaxID=22663 RepID=A0A218WK85_PUNGR|nr:hypothetical protein CDL15_Pgr018327 [Punica granatum]
MVRGGKGGSKRDFKKRAKGDKSSDDSDEDYVVSDEQSDASEDALEDLAGSESEYGLVESLHNEVLNDDDGVNDDDYVEELDEECKEERGGDELEDEVVKSEMKWGSSGQRKSGGKTSRKRNRVTLEEEEGDDVEDCEANDEDYEVKEEGGGDELEDEVVKSEMKWGSSGQRKSGGKTSRKRNRVTLEEEDDDDEDYEANDDDDEDDEEFTPDEDDCLDDEEDSAVKMRNRSKLEAYKKLGRRGTRRKVAKSGRKRRKKLAAPKSLSRKKGRNIKRTRKKARYEDDDEDDAGFSEENMVMRERGRKTMGRSKRRYMVRSDSDFVSSGSSDFEYTISEEEREQVREASEFCRNLNVTPGRWSSSSSERCVKGGYLRLRAAPSRKTEEDVDLPQQRKSPTLKGKQKVEEVNIKQVCGICLSEEDKRRIRGTLNCCSHYFCFTCIMEWSKVESRCPLCKQRFNTISKPARSAAGVDLREAVIQVPERDQVYQPSEEEIRGYLDPYENVICTECHQGGDDGLMLLCDLCDSPAHTYCVGLGREVPEGNWYCEGCRPGALGSSSSYPQDPNLSDQRMGINGGDGLDLNVTPSPLPFTQGLGGLASPRFNGVINQAASFGAGAATVSGRRWIQRHIQQILTGHRMNTLSPRTDGISAVHVGPDPLYSRIDHSRPSPIPNLRTPEMRASLESIFGERLQETSSPSLRSRECFHSRQITSRRQGVEELTVMPPSNTSRALTFNELGGMNNVALAHEQLPQSTSSISTLAPEFTASPHAVREESHFDRAKEQVQSMVKNHLKSISKDVLGHDDFKDIARSSTHTILAACGLDHRKTEVHAGPLPPPLACSHSELGCGGERDEHEIAALVTFRSLAED